MFSDLFTILSPSKAFAAMNVIFRGFHGCVESAQAIMKGYEIFYNFIRKHQAIGVCPYELATDLNLENPNKWMGLIEMAKN